eukprot:4940114-Prymnesium_polylepis.1
MPPVASDVGKYMRIARAMTFKSFGVEVDDAAVVIEHNVTPGDAAKNTTLLAVIRSGDFESFKDSADTFTVEEVKAQAEHLYVGLNNTHLGRLFPGGSWKELFAAGAEKLGVTVPPAIAQSVDAYVNVVFDGEVPTVTSEDEVELIRGTWTVLGYDDSSEKYDLGLADADGGYHSRVGRRALMRFLRDATSSTRRPPADDSSDVEFDATDYPLSVAMVYNHLGDVASMDVSKLGARLAIRAGKQAGAVVPPDALSASATPAALRRHARAALAALEVLLEHEGLSIGDMGTQDIGTETNLMAT